MSDYDRGAYAPPSDSPLAFDARPPRERRPAPFSLILGLIVLAVLAGGLLFMYRGGVRGAGDAPPVVGQPVTAIRTPPDGEAAQPQDPALQLEVYDERNPTAAGTPVPTGGPVFAPEPEQPLVRGGAPAAPAVAPAPTPAAPTADESESSAPLIAPSPAPSATSAPVAPPAAAPRPAARPEPVERRPATTEARTPERPATATTRRTESASTSASAARTATAADRTTASTRTERTRTAATSTSRSGETPSITSVLNADSARRQREAAAARTTSASTSGSAAARPARSGTVSVQIGAFSSRDTARSELSRAGGPGSRVEAVETANGTLYRGVVTGFADRAAAQAFCARQGRQCIIR